MLHAKMREINTPQRWKTRPWA